METEVLIPTEPSGYSAAQLAKSIIAVNTSMITDAKSIIAYSRNPIKKSYWRGRLDAYEAQLRSAQVFLGLDELFEKE